MRLTVTIFAFALCLATPGFAQNIPAGDDVWNTSGNGATYATIASAEWMTLCGVDAPSQTINMTGKNIPGYGTGDTVITRNEEAVFGADGQANVGIVLKQIRFISQGTTPCSPNLIRMREDGTQRDSTMRITREDSLGGTFTASINVNAVYEVVDSAGNVVPGTDSVAVSPTLEEVGGPSPWSYRAPAGALDPGAAWHPGVSKTTLQPVQIRRSCIDIILNEHAYKPATICKVIVQTDEEPLPHEPNQIPNVRGVTAGAIAVPVDKCSVSRTLFSNP